MSRDHIFKITSPQEKAGATNAVKFEITPLAGAPVGGKDAPLRFEFDLEARILPDALRKAETLAGQNPKRLAGCDAALTLAGGAGNWTAWVRDSIKDEVVTVLVTNDLNSATERTAIDQRGTLASPATLSLSVALTPTTRRISLEINYRYGVEYVRGDSVSYEYDGDLELWQVPSGEPPPASMPVVDLSCDAESPTALNLGETVKLFWVIENGKRGKLLGPLSGGDSVLTLAKDELARGHLQLQVLSASVFLLEAEVLHEGETLIVVRSLTLDIIKPEKLCALRLVPAILLPNGNLSVFWWVSGVYDAMLDVGNLANAWLVEEERKPVSAHGEYEVKDTGKIKNNIPINLTVNNNKGVRTTINQPLTYRSWIAEIGALPKEALPTEPHGYRLAHHRTSTQGYLLYATPKGAWLANTDAEDLVFSRTSLEAPCLGLGAGPTGFAVLQKAAAAVQLVVYTPGEKPKIDPLSLPPSLDGYFKHPDVTIHFLVAADRAYIAAYLEVTDEDRERFFTSEAWSLDLAAQDGWRYEPYLAALQDYEPVACGGAIFGFDRETGRLLRLDADPKAANGGTLANPRFCTKGATNKDESLLKTGTPVDVEGLLVFVGSQKKRDWVYNPKSDSWNECGREYPSVRAVAYRGGSSTRMWTVQDDGLYSLSVGAPQIFCPDYRHSRPVASLEHTLFDRSVEYTLTNATGGDLLPLGDTLTGGNYFRTMARSARFAAGEPRLLRKGESAKVVIECDSKDVPEIVWRWRSSQPGLVVRVVTTFTDRSEHAWGFRFYYDNLPAKAGLPSRALMNLTYHNYRTEVSLLKAIKRSRVHLYNGTPYTLQILGNHIPPTNLYTADFGALENVDDYFTKSSLRFWLVRDSDFIFDGTLLLNLNRPAGIAPARSEAENPQVALETTKLTDEQATPATLLQLQSGQTKVSHGGADIGIRPLDGGANYFIGFGQPPTLSDRSRFDHEYTKGYFHRLYLNYTSTFATRVLLEIKSKQLTFVHYGMRQLKHASSPPNDGYVHWESVKLDPTRDEHNSPDFIFTAQSRSATVVVSLTPEYASGDIVHRGKTVIVPFTK